VFTFQNLLYILLLIVIINNLEELNKLMFLTIAGKLGSGKSTICRILSETYGYKIYSTGEIQRKIALDLGISTLELNELMRKDSKYDDLIDNEVIRISNECRTENIIFDSRMAFHFVKNAFNIFTTIDPVEAAKRVVLSPRGCEESYVNQEDAMNKLLERSRVENIRFKEMYGVDNLDYNNYNLIIDTSWEEPYFLAESINKAIETNEKRQILISPKSLYPTQKIREINMDTVNEYVNKAKSKDVINAIKVIYCDNYHYIIDGHHRVIAALINKEPFITAELINNDSNLVLKNIKNLKTELQYVGKSILRDYEDIGKFNYLSYPEYY